MHRTPMGPSRAALALLSLLALALAPARAAETSGPQAAPSAPVVAASVSPVPGLPAALGPVPAPAQLGSLSPAVASAATASAAPSAPVARAPLAAPAAPALAPAAAPGAVPAALPASAVAGPAGQARAAEPGAERGRAPSAREQAESLGRAASGDDAKGGLDAAFDHSAAGAEARADVPGAIEDAAALFRAANPRSAAVYLLSQLAPGRPDAFAVVANELVYSDIFSQTTPGRHELDHVLPPYAPAAIRGAALEVLEYADLADRDPGAARFVRALARRSARDRVDELSRPGRSESLPPNPLGKGEYWDLAAGPNGIRHMMGRRDPHTTYRFFDSNPYVIEFLDEGKRLMARRGMPTANIDIVHADVRALARPPTPIAVLRNKNVHTYVKGFELNLDEMTDWVAEGGQLVLENDPGPQRFATVEKLGPMIERLISQGWTLRFGGFSAQGELETLTLTRPKAGEPQTPEPESQKVWSDYARAVRRSRDMDPLMALMRAMGLR